MKKATFWLNASFIRKSHCEVLTMRIIAYMWLSVSGHKFIVTQQKWDTAMTVAFTFLMCVDWDESASQIVRIFASHMRCFLWVSCVETGYYFGVGELDVNTFHKETAAGLCEWKWLQLQIICSLSLSFSFSPPHPPPLAHDVRNVEHSLLLPLGRGFYDWNLTPFLCPISNRAVTHIKDSQRRITERP